MHCYLMLITALLTVVSVHSQCTVCMFLLQWNFNPGCRSHYSQYGHGRTGLYERTIHTSKVQSSCARNRMAGSRESSWRLEKYPNNL